MIKIQGVPWWSKIGIKLLIGMTPLPYERIRSALTGARGGMESPEYAQRVFNRFYDNFQRYKEKVDNGAFLEIGPGGSLLNGIFGKAMGFKKCFLIDVGNFASPDLALYSEYVKLLKESDQAKFWHAFHLEDDIFNAMKKIGIYYYTAGIESMKSIQTASICFSFSNAVLEHVEKKEFYEFCQELSRIHKRRSLSIHQIDYKDHLGGGLNNLRFSEKIWESPLFFNQGFYTNRLRHREICSFLMHKGFKILQEDLAIWDTLPLPRRKLANDFREMTDEDLRIKGAFIVTQKIAQLA
ncbi:hypothetical protein [Desulfovermiculus halophilus]|uniref:hypothetical protein n=1 Tax=Desulfovermiculus halophilus TaxID=339722 RepID=UPI0004883AD6|nr:hypothetical protein [Desulfovermiculus halophilus]